MLIDVDLPKPTIINDIRNYIWRPRRAESLVSSSGRRYWCRNEATDAGVASLTVFYCLKEVAYVRSRHCKLRCKWEIDDLYIAKPHRLDGLGRILLMKTVRIALERDVWVLVASVSKTGLDQNVDDQRDTLQWYEDFGFKLIPPSERSTTATLQCDLRSFE